MERGNSESKFPIVIIIAGFVIVLLLVGAGIFASLQISDKSDDNGQTHDDEVIEQIDEKDYVFGIIQTTGLSEDERDRYSLNYSQYQLTNLGENQLLDEEVERFFIESESARIQDFWGNCVKVTGKIVDDPIGEMVKVGYGNETPVITIEEISIAEEDSCKRNYREISDIEKYTKPVTGKLVKSIRPAYDIAYDYTLKLNAENPDFAGGNVLPATQIYVMPTSTIEDVFLNMLDKNVSVEGYLEWGYAESRVFIITAITEL